MVFAELVDVNEQLVEYLAGYVLNRRESDDKVYSDGMEWDRRNDNRLEASVGLVVPDFVLQICWAMRNVLA